MLTAALAVSVLAASPAPACTHGQLRVTHGPLNGSAGQLHWPIVFRNAGARACSLRGFPGVSAVTGPRGSSIGSPAVWETALPFGRVRLAARGGRASALFTQTDVDVLPRSSCHPRRAAGLRVFPPNQRRSFYVRLGHRVCAATAGGGSQSSVRPVVAGASGL